MIPETRTMSRTAADAVPGRPARWRRPTWKDPRLAGGIALVAVSVALGAWAVDTAADTDQVYAVTRDVAPGTDLTADGVLTLVSSHPGSGSYVTLGHLPEGAVTTRTLGAGELVPTSAVATEEDVDRRAVVLDVSQGLPEDAGAGSDVDLWQLPTTVTASAEDGTPQATLVAEGIVVTAVGEPGSSLVGTTTTTVEVLVPAEIVSDVLTAVGSGSPLVLVPTGRDA